MPSAAFSDIAWRRPYAADHALDRGEGRFVCLDQCTSPVQVMGVPVRGDAPGIDRKAVHESLARAIDGVLASALSLR